MSKCPNCGYERPYIIKDEGKRYRDAVEKRLAEYGYEEKMSPQKHQMATAIRKVIKLKTGIVCKPGGGLHEGKADMAIAELDYILPGRGMNNEL